MDMVNTCFNIINFIFMVSSNCKLKKSIKIIRLHMASIFNNTTDYLFIFSIKYSGWFSWILGVSLIWVDYWKRIIPNRNISNKNLILKTIFQFSIIHFVSIILYLSVFYIHLSILKKAGPHDSVMTSAFQASLEVSSKLK